MNADPIVAFAESHHEYNGISLRRRRDQVKALRALSSSMSSGDILQLEAQDLREWAESLSASGLNPNTVRYQIQLVRPFVTWAWERKLIPADRLLEIRAVKPPRGATSRGTPNPYSRRELGEFWGALEAAYPHSRDVRAGKRILTGWEAGEHWWGRWSRETSRFRRVRPYLRRAQVEAVVSLALYGGLRRMEIFRLSPEDVNPENEYIVVHGAAKNAEAKSKARAVPWTPASREALARWLMLRERLDPDHDSLWLSAWSKPYLDYPMPERTFCMQMTRLGYEFHRLRHTFATEALRSGMELHVLSRILGHANLEQTMGYSLLVRSDLVASSARIEDKLERALRP